MSPPTQKEFFARATPTRGTVFVIDCVCVQTEEESRYGDFHSELRHPSVDFGMPSDPLADASWILLLRRIYPDPTDSGGKQ